MPFVEGVRLVEMPPVEYAALRIAEKPLAEFLPDPVVGGMAENPCDREQNENEWQVQWTAFCSQCADREQECISWEKWSYHQSGFGKDDQEEQCVDPGPVAPGELIEIKVKMQNDVQKFKNPIHRAKSGNESAIVSFSATEIRKTVRRINLNIRNSNRVYSFERIRYLDTGLAKGGDLIPAKEVKVNI